jgi:hypothetical protein
MAQAQSKAAQKRIAKLAAFLKVCGVVKPKQMTSVSRDTMHALIGGQSKDLKKFLVKAGWTKAYRENNGGGEFAYVYEHPDLSGSLAVIEYRGATHANKVYLSNAQ